MRNAWTIMRRELMAYFVSPIAYVVTALFLALHGYMFSLILFFSQEATMRYLFGTMTTVLLFIAPVLAMRLLAEEYRSGTIELLLTAPLRDWELVLGKWLASVVLWAVMLLFTLVYPYFLYLYGPPDWGPVVSGYVGIFLFGAALLALGTLASALTENQIVAAILGTVFTVGLWVLRGAGDLLGGTLSRVVNYIALADHTMDFTRGVVDTRDLLYFMSVMVLALFLATRAVEVRRMQ